MSDISFVVRNVFGVEVIFVVYKFVLVVSSFVFYVMFFGDLVESKNKIVLFDCDFESFMEFFWFLYSDEVDLIGSLVM